MAPRRARIAFSDSVAKQLEQITSAADIHALDRALVVISVDPDVGEPIPGNTAGPALRQYATKSSRCASCTSSPRCAPLWSSPTSRSSAMTVYIHQVGDP
jgi:hypothetical protein